MTETNNDDNPRETPAIEASASFATASEGNEEINNEAGPEEVEEVKTDDQQQQPAQPSQNSPRTPPTEGEESNDPQDEAEQDTNDHGEGDQRMEEDDERVQLLPQNNNLGPINNHGESIDTAIMIRVRAPATLPEGYTFEAQVNDDPNRTFTCHVPHGGIDEGEEFWAPLPRSTPGPRLQAPFGHWKDGICGCCAYGIGHPHFWCSWVCPQLQLGQVLRRMQMTCHGDPGTPYNSKHSFTLVLSVVMVYTLLSTGLSVAQYPYNDGTVPWSIEGTRLVASLCFIAWFVTILSKARRSVRRHYGIPTRHCGAMEDVCCSLFCTCCTVAQLARHTGDYESYPAVCCTETGHDSLAPMSV